MQISEMLKIGPMTAAVGRVLKDRDVARAGRDALFYGRISATVLVAGSAFAQGFVQGFTNLKTLANLGVGLLIIIGLLGGLGMVLGGLVSAWKKYDSRNDDITWSKIGLQITAGGFAMALGWVGMQVVETLGGSASDIGKSYNAQ
jgi:hypothetical protein